LLKKTFYILALLTLCFNLNAQSWLTGWSNRIPIAIENPYFESAVDYQLRIEVSHENEMEDDFKDLRFTTSDGTTLIDFWVEYYEAGQNAVVWIEVPEIVPTDTEDYYLYFGNPTAESTSDPYATFLFFDDFDEDTGWNDIGYPPSTFVTTFDSVSVMNKFDQCNYKGAWKSINDNITSFRMIAREHKPQGGGVPCNSLEYGLEDVLFNGINLERHSQGQGQTTDFGVAKRLNITSLILVETALNQPGDNWYYTETTYFPGVKNNIAANIRNAEMEMIGGVLGSSLIPHIFDKVTIRGGSPYYMDYIAVGNYNSIEPVITMDSVEYSCPESELISFTGDECEDGLGEIVLGVSGGVPPYSVTWLIEEDTIGQAIMDTVGILTIDSLSQGQYCFKIVDSEGCIEE